MKVKDKGSHNYSDYIEEGVGLVIHSFDHDGAGYISGWELCAPDYEVSGTSLEKLINVLKFLVTKYDLHFNLVRGVESKNTKKVLVIYTDNLFKVRCFLNKYITLEFPLYFQVLDFIEFRPMDIWNPEALTARDIANYADMLIKNIFVPEKYYYLTPNQRPRKLLKATSKFIDLSDIVPKKYHSYTALRKALYGGINYVRSIGRVIEDPMIAIDLTSAYIYCLCVLKHCMSEFTTTDTSDFEYFLDSPSKTSLGLYRITYNSWSDRIRCYKDLSGTHFEKGNNITVNTMMNNIDLKNFIDLADVTNIQCLTLEEANLDYLPKEIIDVIITEYIKKTKFDKNDPLRDVQKATVNGIYGDTIRTMKSEKDYMAFLKQPYLAPQWGIWTTSYCKKLILDVALKVDGWYMSATDSIYCLDTPDNRKVIEEFNNKIRQSVKDFCDRFGYKYNDLKDLGTFDMEEIVKFKAFRHGAYVYTNKNGNVVVKASGCNKEELPNDDSLYKLDTLPTGTRSYEFFNDKHTECTINGTHYESDGSYVENRLGGVLGECALAAILLTKALE